MANIEIVTGELQGVRARPRIRAARLPRPPAVIWVPAAVVAAGMILPLAYLVQRTSGAGTDALDLIFTFKTLKILFRTLLLVSTVTLASVTLAVPIAWLTVRTDLPFRRIWAVLTILPLVIPSYVGAFLLIAAAGPGGLLQQMLEPVGVDWLPNIYGFPGALYALTILSYPYVLLSIRSALWGIDPALEEGSRSLGLGALATFWRVTLPQLRPAMAAGGLLVALYTLSDFGAVSLLRFDSFTRIIFIQYQTAFDRSLAAGLSLVLLAVALFILTGEARLRGRWRYHRSTVGAVRPPTIMRLGRWRWPALIFLGLVTILALIGPMSVLVYWLVRGMLAGEPLRLLWGQTLNSVYVSGLAALAAILASIPLAVLSVRYPSRISSILERLTYVGFAAPGIVVALALVFFAANFATPIYQTMGILVLAYVILFLPTALGSLRTSLLQVNPSVEEAARSLGRNPFQVLTSVTLPLVRPGLLAGMSLVFLITMKELPATLVLSPIGFKTLATSVWAATEEAFFARAAAPALFLILVSSVPMAFLVLRERRFQT